MRVEAKDERVKNEGAITARTVERIAVESAAAATSKHLTPAIPERPTPTRAEQDLGLEEMIQAISEAAQACVEAQIEENQNF